MKLESNYSNKNIIVELMAQNQNMQINVIF